MTRKPHVQFRCDESLLTAVKQIAETEDISKSAAWRDLCRVGIEHHNDSFEHVKNEQHIRRIKKEEKTKQQAAWFRANVGSQLLKAWNGGLSPDEAEDYLHGRKREAEEVHDSERLIEYLEAALSIYREAYPNSGARLSTWLKSRTGVDTSDFTGTDPDATTATNTDIEPDTADESHPDMTVEEAAREFHDFGFDPENISPNHVESVTDGDVSDVRDRVRELESSEDTE